MNRFITILFFFIIVEGDFINDEISQNRYKETIKNIITSR